MSSKIKISIVIPSYNQAKFIETTIVSILDQDHPNIELIIIDGGSKDETVDIIRKYEDRLAYWVSEPDRGQAHAINKGLEKCSGEIFNWINSDDYLEAGALKNIANAFSANKKTNVVCGYTRCFYDEDNTVSHIYRMGVKSTVTETMMPVEMNQPGSFYRTSVVKDLGGVNESLRYVFDDELWFRYLCKYGLMDIRLSENIFAHFRLHHSSKSVGEGFPQFQKEIHALYVDILDNCKAPQWLSEMMKRDQLPVSYVSNGQWDLQHLEKNKFIAAFARKYINSLFLSGQRKEAKEAMKMIIENGYFNMTRMMLSLRLKLLFS